MQSRNEFEDDYHNNSFCNQDYLNSEITNNSYCTLTCLDKILLDSNEVIKSSNGFLKDQNEELVESTKRKRTEGSYSNKEKEYTVIWRQKPVHARMSGNGAKERRTIDPPPILELMEYVNGNLMPIIEENCFTHMRAALYSPDGTISLEELQRGMLKNKATLVGDLIEYSRVLLDDLGRIGTFFVFKDLSIKMPGTYSLKFTLYDLEKLDKPGELTSKTTHKFTLFSPPIRILAPKDFPGIIESSDITKVFNNQGLKLTIRNKELRKKP
ncbi:hypothetical protein HDU92_009184 [Lobulomyces angularis]|nr:hypothetical protein HDU92_009184 [Lobulomyces angularis]